MLSQLNHFHTCTSNFSKIHFNSISLSISRSPEVLTSVQTVYTFLIFPISDVCFTYFSLLCLIIVIYGEEYKFWSSALSRFLKFPVTSSLLGPSSLLKTLFSDIFPLTILYLGMTDQVSHRLKTVGKFGNTNADYNKKLTDMCVCMCIFPPTSRLIWGNI
jgi:hypothetical protein